MKLFDLMIRHGDSHLSMTVEGTWWNVDEKDGMLSIYANNAEGAEYETFGTPAANLIYIRVVSAV